MKQEYKKIVFIGLGVLAVTGASALTIAAIKKRRFSSKGKGVGADSRKEDLIGKTLELGSSSFVNIRSTPEIPKSIEFEKETKWYDWATLGLTYVAKETTEYLANDTEENVLEKKTTNPIGVIKEVIVGKDGWNWYKITYKGFDYGSVIDAATNWGTQISAKDKTGYVREDVVTVKY